MNGGSTNYYYLFTSGSNCCSSNPDDYAVSVARSTSVTGPYATYMGPSGTDSAATILHANSNWYRPGSNGIFQGGGGNDWIIYSAVKAGGDGTRVLLIDPITWVNGWPRVNPTAASPDSPSNTSQPAPLPYRGKTHSDS